MKQLKSAQTELEALKAKLQEKAPLADMLSLRSEVEKKASKFSNEKIAAEVETVR